MPNLCWKCQTEAVPIGRYEFEETQTVQVLKWPKCYCEPGECECEPWMGLEDQTYTQRTAVFECPACHFVFVTDWEGIGLANLGYSIRPEDHEDENGKFIRYKTL